MEKNTTPGSIRRWMLALTGVASALALAACGGGGGGGDSQATGTLQMNVTDAPACYSSVKVNVLKLRVHTSEDTATGDNDGGWKDIVPAGAPVQIDLVNLTNGQTLDLGSTVVPAGNYHQIRLVLANNGNTVTPIGGTPQPLTTPSGQQSGLKINADFSVAANTLNSYLMDFDACKSIVLTGSGKYLLKPVVHVTTMPSGAIQGYVSSNVTVSTVSGTTTTTATGVLSAVNVSAQQNGTVIRSTIPDNTGKFLLKYLPAGTYTVVVTGDGVTTSGTLDTTKGAATRVVDSVPVGTSTVSLNTSTSSLALTASSMSTVTGTLTPSTTIGTTTIADNANIAALQNVGSRQVEVNGTRPDDTLKYSLHLPLAAPELQMFSTAGLPAATAYPSDAGQYTIRVWGNGLPTKDRAITLTTSPQVVDFSY